MGSSSAPKSRRRWGTIGTHLVGLVSIQLVLVLGLIGFSAVQDFSSARTEVSGAVAATSVLAADHVARVLEDDRRSLDQVPALGALIASPTVCEFTKPEEDWADGGFFRSRFYLLELDGTSACQAQQGEAPIAYGATAWFKQAVKSAEPVEAGPINDAASDEQVMVSALAIPEHDKIVALITDLSSLGPMLNHTFGKSSLTSSFLMTSKDGSVLLGATDGKSGRDLAGTSFSRRIKGASTFAGLDGVRQIYADAEVPGFGFHLYAGVSESDALAGANRSLRERMILAGIMVLILIAAAMFLHRRFVRPVRSLAKVMRKATAGDLNAKVRPGGPVEMNELGESFNQMIEIRKQSEAALRKAYRVEKRAAEELRDVDSMRNAFLMAMSHELRTPLTSVVGYSEFLMDVIDEVPGEDVRTCIQAIARQSKRLERLLLDLLDVERLSRGIIEPNLLDTDISQLIMHVVERSSGNGRISVAVKGSVRATVDPALVERMVENLVVNALKHTPPDSPIWVRAKRVNGHLRLSVDDCGNGVPDEIKTAIFEPFKQGVVQKHSPGTGVGLNLVAQFAKLHGGRVWVEDRPGGGAVFRIEMPAGPSGKRRPAKRSTKTSA